MAQAQGWPVVGQVGQNSHQHAQNLRFEAEKIVEHASKPTKKGGKESSIPFALFQSFSNSVIKYLDDADDRPNSQQLLEVINRIEFHQKGMRNDIGTIKINTDPTTRTIPPTATSSRGIRNWASVVAGTPPAAPPSIRTRLSGSSGAASINNPETRKIILRLNDTELAQSLRIARNPEKHVVQKLNAFLQKDAPTTINKARFTAANFLPSYDIALFTDTAGVAELLRNHREDWEKVLGSKAEVKLPTYGAIMHGMPANLDIGNARIFGEKLVSENFSALQGAKVRSLQWLKKPSKEAKAVSIVVAFEKAQWANAAIASGQLIWENAMRNVEPYSPACKLIQCFNCQEYGHIAPQCRNTVKCGHCAEEHETKSCSRQSEGKKCCLCKAAHTAWDSRCEKRKAERRRMADAKSALRANPFFPEEEKLTAKVTPGPSEMSSQPSQGRSSQRTPLNQSRASSQSRPMVEVPGPEGSITPVEEGFRVAYMCTSTHPDIGVFTRIRTVGTREEAEQILRERAPQVETEEQMQVVLSSQIEEVTPRNGQLVLRGQENEQENQAALTLQREGWTTAKGRKRVSPLSPSSSSQNKQPLRERKVLKATGNLSTSKALKGATVGPDYRVTKASNRKVDFQVHQDVNGGIPTSTQLGAEAVDLEMAEEEEGSQLSSSSRRSTRNSQKTAGGNEEEQRGLINGRS